MSLFALCESAPEHHSITGLTSIYLQSSICYLLRADTQQEVLGTCLSACPTCSPCCCIYTAVCSLTGIFFRHIFNTEILLLVFCHLFCCCCHSHYPQQQQCRGVVVLWVTRYEWHHWAFRNGIGQLRNAITTSTATAVPRGARNSKAVWSQGAATRKSCRTLQLFLGFSSVYVFCRLRVLEE